jgi:hypothetical protein
MSEKYRSRTFIDEREKQEAANFGALFLGRRKAATASRDFFHKMNFIGR